RLALARMYHEKKRYAAAARLWADALAADPTLGDNRRTQHRYNAACDAALAAAGKGKDDSPPDAEARAKERSQAPHWLRAERHAWAKLLDGSDTKARPLIARALQHWKADPDLAGVRDLDDLKALPESERDAWRALWTDVDRQLREGKAP